VKEIPNLLISKTTIEALENALARAKSGEVIAVTIIEEYKGGTYSSSGSSTSSRTQTAGMLLDAAMTRLKQ
jgi:hypothetical protein